MPEWPVVKQDRRTSSTSFFRCRAYKADHQGLDITTEAHRLVFCRKFRVRVAGRDKARLHRRSKGAGVI